MDLPYISELDISLLTPHDTLEVKSPIGSGKTRLFAKLIQAEEKRLGRPLRILVVVHRRALSASLTKRLNDELKRVAFTNYEGLTCKALRQTERLVICLNSVHKLRKTGGVLPVYDIILVDEVEQVLTHKWQDAQGWQSCQSIRSLWVTREDGQTYSRDGCRCEFNITRMAYPTAASKTLYSGQYSHSRSRVAVLVRELGKLGCQSNSFGATKRGDDRDRREQRQNSETARRAIR